MADRPALKFLMDNNVPEGVARFLLSRGHDVTRVRDIMPSDSPDPIVATAAINDGRILVSWDRDFNHQRFQRDRFRALQRIGFSCPEPDGERRLSAVIERVEFEASQSSPERPLLMKIASDKILIRC